MGRGSGCQCCGGQTRRLRAPGGASTLARGCSTGLHCELAEELEALGAPSAAPWSRGRHEGAQGRGEVQTEGGPLSPRAKGRLPVAPQEGPLWGHEVGWAPWPLFLQEWSVCFSAFCSQEVLSDLTPYLP